MNAAAKYMINTNALSLFILLLLIIDVFTIITCDRVFYYQPLTIELQKVKNTTINGLSFDKSLIKLTPDGYSVIWHYLFSHYLLWMILIFMIFINTGIFAKNNTLDKHDYVILFVIYSMLIFILTYIHSNVKFD